MRSVDKCRICETLTIILTQGTPENQSQFQGGQKIQREIIENPKFRQACFSHFIRGFKIERNPIFGAISFGVNIVPVPCAKFIHSFFFQAISAK